MKERQEQPNSFEQTITHVRKRTNTMELPGTPRRLGWVGFGWVGLGLVGFGWVVFQTL
jgi:hypothetical protein